MNNLCRETGTPPTELLSKVGLPRCKRHLVPAEPGWDCAVTVSHRSQGIHCPRTGPNTPGTCPRTVLKKKQKFNIVMKCHPSNPECSVKHLTESLILLESCLPGELPRRTVLHGIQSERQHTPAYHPGV